MHHRPAITTTRPALLTGSRPRNRRVFLRFTSAQPQPQPLADWMTLPASPSVEAELGLLMAEKADLLQKVRLLRMERDAAMRALLKHLTPGT
jgi:hypothetical protein